MRSQWSVSEDEGTDGVGGASALQGTSKIPSNHQKLGERHGTDSLTDSLLRRQQPCWHLHLGLVASRTEATHFCCLSHSAVLCYPSPSNWIQGWSQDQNRRAAPRLGAVHLILCSSCNRANQNKDRHLPSSHPNKWHRSYQLSNLGK